MNKWQFPIAGALCGLILAGCGAMPVSSNVKASPAQIAKYNALPALDVVATLEKNVNEARSSGMPFLAPRYFRDASQVLSRCQNSLGNKSREELAACAAQGDAILEKGRAIMDIVKYRFAQELALKAQLDALSTEKLLPKEYAKVTGDLSALIDIVEREQPNNIDKEKDAVLKAMQALEVQSVQEGALHESDAINADSKKKNADKQAPLTFAEAQKVYQEVKAKIAAAYHDRPQVQRLGAEALFAARHAQQVNERVALLQSQLRVQAGGGASLSGTMGSLTGAQLSVQADGKAAAVEKVTLEKIVLQEENRLLEIAGALGLEDMRDRSLEKQVEEMKRAARGQASQPRVEADSAALQELDARLKASNEATRQALAQVAEKDQQLAAKDRQLETQAAQLSEKDAQINALTEKITQLEKTPTPVVKSRKPVKAKVPEPRKQ